MSDPHAGDHRADGGDDPADAPLEDDSPFGDPIGDQADDDRPFGDPIDDRADDPLDGRADDGAEDDSPLDAGVDAGSPGEGIVTASVAGTVLFALVAVPAAAFPDAVAVPAAVVDGVLFAIGTVAFLAAYVVAVRRSRTDDIAIGGVFLLSGGTAPDRVRRRLVGALIAQTVIAFATAAVRIYTPVAFGVLVPMLGLGLMGLWGARHGTFPRRRPRDPA